MERDLMADVAAPCLGSGAINRRLAFVRWVRRTHGWFGLWGALLGLMTGVSGVWLNHRAVMKLPLPDQQQSSAQLALPDPRPQTVEEMVAWLQQALKIDRPANNIKVDRARPVPWVEKAAEKGDPGSEGAKPAMQPERWSFTLGGPNKMIQVEDWLGNKAASVRAPDNAPIATLTNA